MADDLEFPEPGEIVLATVAKIIAQGAYVTLDEYDNMQGFLHTQEIAPGWIKAINRYVKKGEKKVLRVKKINPRRGDIDLSLKQVSNDQRKRKLREVKRYEKGRTLLHNVGERANLSEEMVKGLEDSLYVRFDTIYEAFLNMAKNGTKVLEDLKIESGVIRAVQEVCEKLRLPTVEIRGVMEITCSRQDGVDIIKGALENTNRKYAGSAITYLGAPKYRVAIVADDFKTAEKTLKPMIAEIQAGIEGHGGTFAFTREESRKNRED